MMAPLLMTGNNLVLAHISLSTLNRFILWHMEWSYLAFPLNRPRLRGGSLNYTNTLPPVQLPCQRCGCGLKLQIMLSYDELRWSAGGVKKLLNLSEIKLVGGIVCGSFRWKTDSGFIRGKCNKFGKIQSVCKSFCHVDSIMILSRAK